MERKRGKKSKLYPPNRVGEYKYEQRRLAKGVEPEVLDKFVSITNLPKTLISPHELLQMIDDKSESDEETESESDNVEEEQHESDVFVPELDYEETGYIKDSFLSEDNQVEGEVDPEASENDPKTNEVDPNTNEEELKTDGENQVESEDNQVEGEVDPEASENDPKTNEVDPNTNEEEPKTDGENQVESEDNQVDGEVDQKAKKRRYRIEPTKIITRREMKRLKALKENRKFGYKLHFSDEDDSNY